MKLATEDFLGRALLLVVLSMLTVLKAYSTIHVVQAQMPGWEFDLVAGVAGLAFQVLVIVLTLIRLPAKDSALGWEPRLSAIAGSFLMLSVVALPPSAILVEWKMVAAGITTVGVVLSLYCVWWLGRSFSIMATARKLVTAGPYAVVRHPLYASEMLTLSGIAITNFSLGAVVLLALTLGFQFRRMFNEERVLRAAFPEYEAYAASVPLILPRFPRAAKTAA